MTEQQSPIEIVAQQSPIEIAAQQSPIEIVAQQSPTEIVAQQSPIEIVTQQSPIEIVTQQSPIETVVATTTSANQSLWQVDSDADTLQNTYSNGKLENFTNTSLNDSQSEQRDWLWSNHQASNLHTPMCQQAYEQFPQNVHQQVSQQPALDGPHAAPIKQRPNTSYLSSSSIRKNCLKNPEDVIRKYPKLRSESKAGKLAVKLAQEAYFGEDVLLRCTVNGFREHPALPIAELIELKQMMLMQFPKYWNSVQEFESLWLICSDAIGQAAKGLRTRAR